MLKDLLNMQIKALIITIYDCLNYAIRAMPCKLSNDGSVSSKVITSADLPF